MDQAGLDFASTAAPLAAPVFVDREMWEKIVLNLLSNAFKFTLDGQRRRVADAAGRTARCCAVRDTGVGIPGDELPRVFERFHRVEGARGRSHEGSGIGLALVQELVKLHGGDDRGRERAGPGQPFHGVDPARHAPISRPSRSSHGRSGRRHPRGASPYAEEALRWLPGRRRRGCGRPADTARATSGADARDAARVLLADDNADMRDYARRLLADAVDGRRRRQRPRGARGGARARGPT